MIRPDVEEEEDDGNCHISLALVVKVPFPWGLWQSQHQPPLSGPMCLIPQCAVSTLTEEFAETRAVPELSADTPVRAVL